MDRKKYELVLLTPAQKEIEEIARLHQRLVGSQPAKRITDQIYHLLERLEQFPLSGVQPDDRQLKREGYRLVISGEYICVYRLIGDVVYVYHIAHGVTDYPTLFKGVNVREVERCNVLQCNSGEVMEHISGTEKNGEHI